MQSSLSKALCGMLALVVLLVMPAAAQTDKSVSFTLTVQDGAGAAIQGATVQQASGEALGRSDASGRATVKCAPPCQLRIEAQGFKGKFVEISANATVTLEPAGATQQVTVTAYREPLGELQSPVTTRALSQQDLRSTATISVDGKVRQLPGVELFRRSSALVANPSSQGVSLRGLGSTSASRTLVSLDDVPLNDPVGDWIHWLEEPQLAIHTIELVRGGASDLYGSSAIGGVLSVGLVQPSANSVTLRSSYGGEGTFNHDFAASGKRGPWGALFAGSVIGTDGYIQEAPWQRGPVDVNSNVHAQNALLYLDRSAGPLRLFARGSAFNEDRHNGTPFQINNTRVWRYATGGDWTGPSNGVLGLRLYGSTETYRQTFSSISDLPAFGDPTCARRCGETPTRFTHIPDNELGGALHYSQPIGLHLLVLAGSDVHDVRVWDDEQTFSGTGSLSNLSVHQRDSGLYGETLWTPGPWTIALSGRIDWFQNYDAHQTNYTTAGPVPAPAQPPQFEQTVIDPRLGISRKLGAHWALNASGFRAFRAPSPSELYRSTQVGNQLTKPNGSLQSERATGWEAGVASQWRWGTIRTSWFDTQINRPISAVTINAHSSPILLQRENLGQIESKGVSVDFEAAPRTWMTVDGGYQYAHATVTRGAQDLGNWIPEVARNMATLNLRAFTTRLGLLSLQSRLSGRQYDDDANANLLHSYFRIDAYASHDLGHHLELFAAGENLFDRTIEVAKTPTTTLGAPRTARAGIELKLGGGL